MAQADAMGPIQTARRARTMKQATLILVILTVMLYIVFSPIGIAG